MYKKLAVPKTYQDYSIKVFIVHSHLSELAEYGVKLDSLTIYRLSNFYGFNKTYLVNEYNKILNEMGLTNA